MRRRRRRHTTQYFEMFANRAIYHDGWVAATTPPIAPWAAVARPSIVDGYKWELYNVGRGLFPSGRSRREGARKLQGAAAPLLHGGREVQRAADRQQPSSSGSTSASGRASRAGGSRSRITAAWSHPRRQRARTLKNKSFGISADVEIPKGGADGMLITHGGRFAGSGSTCSRASPSSTTTSPASLATRCRQGAARARAPTPSLDFKYDGGGIGKGGHGDDPRGWQDGREWPHRRYHGLPHVARRDARHRRGHRHAGQRGLPCAVQVSPAR